MKLDLSIHEVSDVIAAIDVVQHTHGKKQRVAGNRAMTKLFDKIVEQRDAEMRRLADPDEPLFAVRYSRKSEVDFAPDDVLETHIRAKGWREVWKVIEADESLFECEILAVEKCDG